MSIIRDCCDAAKEYSRLGWRAVVLHNLVGKGSACSCTKGADCPSPAKHPRLKGWEIEATTNPDEIEQLWRRWPDANLGIRLGPSSGLIDVEFDSDEGEQTAVRLLGDPRTPTYRSARSVHRLFAYPQDLTPEVSVITHEGLEIRLGYPNAEQSVFPPSLHASGVRYSWLSGHSPSDCDLLPLPDSIREIVETHATWDGQFIMEADVDDLATHPGEAEGKRHKTFLRLVGRWLATGNTNSEELWQQAQAWASRCRPPYPIDRARKQVDNLWKKEWAKRQPTAQPIVMAAQPAPGPEPNPLRLRSFAEVVPRDVDWLWKPRIAFGKLALLVSPGGLGKTLVALDVAARLSRGDTWPDGVAGCQGETLFLSAEDDAEDTLRPRLDAAGAEVGKVHCMAEDSDFVSLVAHLGPLEQTLKQRPEIRLIVFDSLPDYIGQQIDDHKNASLRQVLKPLVRLCQRYRVACLGICHINKRTEGRVTDRILGSVAYSNVSRGVHMIAADPEDSERRIFFEGKNNLGNSLPLAFSLQFAQEQPRVAWEPEPIFIDTYALMAANGKQGKRQEAAAWLADRLSDGQVSSTDIIADGEAKGFSEKTLRRAKETINADAFQENRQWFWVLRRSDAHSLRTRPSDHLNSQEEDIGKWTL